ncbi:MAG: hypothetical protein AAGB32_05920 [Pseudomonadota bacterium]
MAYVFEKLALTESGRVTLNLSFGDTKDSAYKAGVITLEVAPEVDFSSDDENDVEDIAVYCVSAVRINQPHLINEIGSLPRARQFFFHATTADEALRILGQTKVVELTDDVKAGVEDAFAPHL